MGAIRRRHQGGHLGCGAGEGTWVQGQARGALARGGEVHVGEGAVRGDRVGVLQHAAGEIGVKVEGEHDPAAVAEIGAHLFEEVSLGIVLAVGGRGPVQVEDEHVERHCAATRSTGCGSREQGAVRRRAAEGGAFPAGCGDTSLPCKQARTCSGAPFPAGAGAKSRRVLNQTAW